MKNFKGYKTPFSQLRIGDLYVYTGNGLDRNKNLYELLEMDYDDEDEFIVMKKLGENPSRVWKVVASDKLPFMNVRDIDDISLREILSDNMYKSYLERKELKKDYRSEPTEEIITGENKMKNVKDQVLKVNTEAAKVAGLITAGNVINETLITKLRPQLPMLMRGYADHALADVVVANIANFAINNFASDNKQAVLASEAMMLAAMTKLVASFNIEEIIAEVLKDVKLPGVDNA